MYPSSFGYMCVRADNKWVSLAEIVNESQLIIAYPANMYKPAGTESGFSRFPVECPLQFYSLSGPLSIVSRHILNPLTHSRDTR
ncbi:CLUMA_CG015608, isoform A [Clunio marinus]|uniref:CLUMA_CG015608, isoform A n=1 Tax=Clunio marinus TaxID=568069 RepID=A0A1J1IS02_9DIPT|nr:CLUMA_CG015608, isoform A [Clunio marinus]